MSLFKANPINDETLADVVPNGVPKPEDRVPPHITNADPAAVIADASTDIAVRNVPEMLTCDNATHFKAPNGRVFAATDILRRMSKSDGKLQPCDAPQKPPVTDE